uniref:Uncharacterized protein LOC104232924 n=1 Tax=Nicotiana sylvestris TaxID=4096 RepID=A0A1U7WX69_NICSY|nr:PREDICTED: uncharacterized protein LOC104232924 [Nicotiana sylvestris]
MGLNEADNGVRGNILMMKPLPFTAQAYSIVLHDESQREIQSDTSFSVESSAFMVSGKKWAPRKHHEGAKVGIPNSGADGKRSDLFCNYCKKFGHVKEGCYKLIGYPPHFKFNRQKQGAYATPNANSASCTPELTTGISGNGVSSLVQSHGFSKEQVKQLISMFQSIQNGGSTSNPAASPSANLAVLSPPILVPSKKRDQIFGKAASGLYVLKDNTRQLESRSIKPHTPVSSLSNVASKSCSPVPSSKYESVCPKSLYPGDKLAPRAIPGVFLGYPFGKKGYKILNLQTNNIFVSRDVKFVETIFPFSFLAPMTKLFPDSFPKSVLPSHNPIPTSKVQSPFTTHSTTSPHSLISPTSPNGDASSPTGPHTPTSPIFLYPSPPAGTQDSLEPVLSSSHGPELRKSIRVHNAPKYLSDYLCNNASSISPNPPFLPFHSFCFSALTKDNQGLISSICHINEPQTYHQAAAHPGWQDAMVKEFEALASNHTWDIVELPEGKKALPCKWVYKVKLKSDGTLE